MADAYFTTETLDFLQDLEVHNDRDWFAANRDRYEVHARAAMQRFITDVAGPLRRVSRHFVADPRGNGGSMFRIHRDLRFSSDPSPYKTNIGAHLRHEQARDAHAPGFYLHVEPGNAFFGAGTWLPPTPVLTAIRTRIVAHPAAWTRAVHTAERGGLTLEGEQLKRAPRGFDPDHPRSDDLRRKSFVLVAPLDEPTVTGDDLLGAFSELMGAARPFVRFLCRAVDVPF
jgi:uncharacterized protein (TIGR02453 family)